MKQSYWAYWLILLGIFVIGVMMLVNGTTTNSTQDYYMLKEVTQASMIDALDFSYYRVYGTIRMSKMKFTENFLRRFSETNSLAKNYAIEFYDIYEIPPKASIKISSVTNSFNVGQDSDTSFDVVNKIDAILEYGVNGGSDPEISSEKLCPLGVYDSFRKYVVLHANDGTLDNYGVLKNFANSSDKNDFNKFRDAVRAQYPNLARMSENDMRNDSLLGTAINGKMVCFRNVNCN